jgi:AGCS family alanine or glycine:cation symporter
MIFKGIGLSMKRGNSSNGDVSPFGALSTSLAATIGTGNIVGVATAIALGGPGAVFWCWLTGLFGIATKYSEAFLAVKYRVKTKNGNMLGGPMYALEKGLKAKWLAVLFCIFTLFAGFGIGNMAQANSISLLVGGVLPISTKWIGIILAILTALVIIFGIKGIAKVCSTLVPIMALFYIAGCVFILFINAPYLGRAVTLIFESAFTPEAAGGGFIGATVMTAARFGIARGLFSNESGLGSAPIAAAAAKTPNPVRQALISSTGPFWDTVVICALTGLVLVSSILSYPDISYSDGGSLTKLAFSKIPILGEPLLAIGIFTFAFSTILGWSYYTEKAMEYLGGKRIIIPFRVVWVAAVYFGSVANILLVWNISDCMNAFMALPNLIAVLLLSGVTARETKKYLWGNRLDEKTLQDW